MMGKKSIIAFVTVFAMIFLNLTVANANISETASSFYVNPIRGLHPDFIKGADVSMLAQIEQSGGKFMIMELRKIAFKF